MRKKETEWMCCTGCYCTVESNDCGLCIGCQRSLGSIPGGEIQSDAFVPPKSTPAPVKAEGTPKKRGRPPKKQDA